MLSREKKKEAKYSLNGTNGQLYVYEDKVEIDRKGYSRFAQSKVIPIKEIKSVQLKLAGTMGGYIQLGVGDEVELHISIWRVKYDENTIEFNAGIWKDNNTMANNIKNYIEKCIMTASQPAIVAGGVSAADEILKFKSLLDQGIISEEEFDAKKKKLLG